MCNGDLTWCLMEAVSGQTGITISCILHIIQVYLKKNTIRIIMIRMPKKVSEPKCERSNYYHIHIFMFGFHGNMVYQMKEKLICYIMVYSCYGLFLFLRYF